MDPDEIHHLYALALALVPEPNAAGDIFLAAPDAAGLRRRAAAWRRRHGLPPLAGDPPLPVLDAEQQLHARHLHSRRRRRRQARPLLAAATVALAVTGALALRPLPTAPAIARQSDATFSRSPVDQTRAGGLRFALYRAEATPAGVTAWWSLSGPGAGLAARSLRPELFSVQSNQWLAPSAVEVTAQRSAGGEVAHGISHYSVLQLTWRTAMLRAPGPLAAEALRAPIQRGIDPGDPTWSLRQSASTGPFTFTVNGITAGSDYTALRYEVQIPAAAIRFRHEPAIEVGGIVLRPLEGTADWGDTLLRAQAIFGPLPPDTRRLVIRWTALAPAGRTLGFALDPRRDVQRDSTTARTVVTLPQLERYSGDATFIDSQGGQWRVDSHEVIGNSSDGPRVRMIANGIPPEADLVRLVVDLIDPLPPATMVIELRP